MPGKKVELESSVVFFKWSNVNDVSEGQFVYVHASRTRTFNNIRKETKQASALVTVYCVYIY